MAQQLHIGHKHARIPTKAIRCGNRRGVSKQHPCRRGQLTLTWVDRRWTRHGWAIRPRLSLHRLLCHPSCSACHGRRPRRTRHGAVRQPKPLPRQVEAAAGRRSCPRSSCHCHLLAGAGHPSRAWSWSSPCCRRHLRSGERVKDGRAAARTQRVPARPISAAGQMLPLLSCVAGKVIKPGVATCNSACKDARSPALPSARATAAPCPTTPQTIL